MTDGVFVSVYFYHSAVPSTSAHMCIHNAWMRTHICMHAYIYMDACIVHTYMA